MPWTRNAAPSTDDDRTIQAFRMLSLAIEAMRHAVANHFGISVTEAMTLSELALHGSRTPRELSDSLDVPPSSVTRVVDRLEAAGGVVRVSVPGDRRQLAVTITDQGRAWLQWSSDQAREALATIPEGEMSGVVACMEALALAVKAQAERIQGADRAT